MKKITTQTEKEKKNKKNQIILGTLLIFLMVFSTLGYSLINSGYNNDPTSVYEYNGIKFTQNAGYYSFEFNSNSFLTLYNPLETENITINNSLTLNNYIGKPLYFDSESPEVNSEIVRNLNNFILRTQNACISEDNCLSNYPIKNCLIDNVIISREPKEDEIERIYQEQNCVYIIASDENKARYSDAFLYDILGI